MALVNYAACGHLTKIGKAEDLDRKEVVANYKVIKPLIEHLGPSSMETMGIAHPSTQVSGLRSMTAMRRWRPSCSTRGLADERCRADTLVLVGMCGDVSMAWRFSGGYLRKSHPR